MKNNIYSYLRRICLFGCFMLYCLGVNAQCTYYPASAGATPAVTPSFAGGFFASFGCAPIDPTYWVAGGGPFLTFTFTAPQTNPSIRVWGMNTDDFASIRVNGIPYPLNLGSAYEIPKVVCGISPGPLGVVFNGGNLQGGNTPAQGNYSYSDVVLTVANVNSITLTAIAGAGWGIAGTSINCVVPLPEIDDVPFVPNPSVVKEYAIWPNPTNGLLTFQTPGETQAHFLFLFNSDGKLIAQFRDVEDGTQIDLSEFPAGIYYLQISDGRGLQIRRKVLKL